MATKADPPLGGCSGWGHERVSCSGGFPSEAGVETRVQRNLMTWRKTDAKARASLERTEGPELLTDCGIHTAAGVSHRGNSSGNGNIHLIRCHHGRSGTERARVSPGGKEG